jgi:hypothetical protein
MSQFLHQALPEPAVAPRRCYGDPDFGDVAAGVPAPRTSTLRDDAAVVEGDERQRAIEVQVLCPPGQPSATSRRPSGRSMVSFRDSQEEVQQAIGVVRPEACGTVMWLHLAGDFLQIGRDFVRRCRNFPPPL